MMRARAEADAAAAAAAQRASAQRGDGGPGGRFRAFRAGQTGASATTAAVAPPAPVIGPAAEDAAIARLAPIDLERYPSGHVHLQPNLLLGLGCLLHNKPLILTPDPHPPPRIQQREPLPSR
jgi:hypothetical protein